MANHTYTGNVCQLDICNKPAVKHGKFCSSSCAAKHNNRLRKPRSAESRKRTSDAIKNSEKAKADVERRKQYGSCRVSSKRCKVCNSLFFVKGWNGGRVTCSYECYCKTVGGYKLGSGRSKSGKYKGHHCDSTYELCWVIYSLDHNIKFTRFKGKLSHNGITYIPDFLLDDGKTIIELKGYEAQDSVDRKTEVAEHYGYKVIVLRKDDLKDIFEYVKLTYGTGNFYTLYDNHKLKYSYTCSNCNADFSKDRLITTEEKFCNRSCAGKYRNKKRYNIF